MRPIFKNPEIETNFRRYGFVVLKANDLPKVEEIKQHLLQLTPDDNYQGFQETRIKKQSFHITFFDSNTEYKRKMYDYCQALFNAFSDQYFLDYTCAQANVFLKPKHSGFVYPHQNITIVDETKFTSVSMWMPLQDTHEKNGTIHLIPGSQHQFSKYRNTHVYWPYVSFFKDDIGRNYFEPINVKSGEILLLDDRIVHYTPDNVTDRERWVVHSLWKPHEAQLLFVDPKQDEVNVYEVEDDFWQFHSPGASELNRPCDYSWNNDEELMSNKQLVELLDDLQHRFKVG